MCIILSHRCFSKALSISDPNMVECFKLSVYRIVSEFFFPEIRLMTLTFGVALWPGPVSTDYISLKYCDVVPKYKSDTET